jgi:NhaP-type Na+/H+ and K+/H+ antiporter
VNRFGGIDDEARQRELGRSWPQALARAVGVAVVAAVVAGLATWLLGTWWINGAVVGFFGALASVLAPRVMVLREARQGRQ